ncbi:MAG: DUF4160 domain-containing protein [Clostridia bacterium]
MNLIQSIINHIFTHIMFGEKCVVDINTCELIAGNINNKQLKLILAWAELHKEELIKNWK